LPEILQFNSDIDVNPAAFYSSNNRLHPVVSQFSQAVRADPSKKQHLVAISPLVGMAMVNIPEDYGLFKNRALPTSTGRKADAATLDMKSLEPEERAAIDAQFTWEGKHAGAGLASNDRVHPGAYREFSADFIAASFPTLTMPVSYEIMEPVIGKLAARIPRPVVPVSAPSLKK